MDQLDESPAAKLGDDVTPGEAGLGNMATDALLVLAQVGLNLLVGLIMVFNEESRNVGAALLIAGALMGVIGFGACIGKVAIFWLSLPAAILHHTSH